jgi:hypothetical protein
MKRLSRNLIVSFLLFEIVLISNGQAEVSEVKSDFRFGEDGWTIIGGIEGMHAPMLLKGVDEGSKEWFFSAPADYLGDRSNLYGGTLSYRLGFFEYEGNFEGTFDTYLESAKHGMTLVMSGSIAPRSFLNEPILKLTENGGWLVNGTSGAPSRHDFRRVLGSLSKLLIRGGYYSGAEDTYLMTVAMRTADEVNSNVHERESHKRTNDDPLHSSAADGNGKTPKQQKVPTASRASLPPSLNGAPLGELKDADMVVHGTEGSLALTPTHFHYAPAGAPNRRTVAVPLSSIGSVDTGEGDDDSLRVLDAEGGVLILAGRLSSYDILEVFQFQIFCRPLLHNSFSGDTYADPLRHFPHLYNSKLFESLMYFPM